MTDAAYERRRADAAGFDHGEAGGSSDLGQSTQYEIPGVRRLTIERGQPAAPQSWATSDWVNPAATAYLRPIGAGSSREGAREETANWLEEGGRGSVLQGAVMASAGLDLAAEASRELPRWPPASRLGQPVRGAESGLHPGAPVT
jgi:hypothetical protein